MLSNEIQWNPLRRNDTGIITHTFWIKPNVILISNVILFKGTYYTLDCMTVWLHDCMTVDIIDMLDRLEDKLDRLNSLRVTWERKSCNNTNCCVCRRHNSFCCCQLSNLSNMSKMSTVIQSCSHTVIQSYSRLVIVVVIVVVYYYYYDYYYYYKGLCS